MTGRFIAVRNDKDGREGGGREKIKGKEKIELEIGRHEEKRKGSRNKIEKRYVERENGKFRELKW